MKQDKKQTAVDFIRVAIELKLGMKLSPSYYELFEIAKEIEKKNIIFAKIKSCNSMNCEKPLDEKLKCSCGPYFYEQNF